MIAPAGAIVFLVSNVPFILVVREQLALLPDPRLGYELLAVISTFAGNCSCPHRNRRYRSLIAPPGRVARTDEPTRRKAA